MQTQAHFTVDHYDALVAAASIVSLARLNNIYGSKLIYDKQTRIVRYLQDEAQDIATSLTADPQSEAR